MTLAAAPPAGRRRSPPREATADATVLLLAGLVDLAVVLFGVSVIVFLMIRLIPGDAVAIMLGANTEVTPERIAELRARIGLDQPIARPVPALGRRRRCTATSAPRSGPAGRSPARSLDQRLADAAS